MDQPIRSAFSFFSKKYERILLIILFVQLPLLMGYLYFANYMYLAVPPVNSVFGIADIMNGFFMISLLIFAQVPFTYFWYYEEIGKEKPARLAFLQSAIRAFHFYLFSLAAAFLITIGLALFVIPGIILMSIFLSASIIAVIDEKSVWKSIKDAFRIFKKHHWKIVLILFSFGISEFILSIVIQQFVLNITTSYLAVVLSHVFVNTVFLPLMFLTLAFCTAKWKDGLGLYELEENEMLT
ncbi:hypothetical protein KP77_01640 [Jeotgalibacillus alimentarius]|uniref:Uncharacterized protein n=1 Tax=Jeotgalibacillus alimentarius TaxID=135826 RepID=A0A0C2SIA9_9BACL|nr:hypothetical protein [Jeotgalibacillus alimentarius]KIL53669.1 hypothetical protein KP77_01640 [Jeotgalibacillus alimentarius]